MVCYRRNFVSEATYFFTVCLADRRAATLTTHINSYDRPSAKPSSVPSPRSMPSPFSPTICTRSGPSRSATAITPVDGAE
jgi:hypothetical protein